jgi:hypothetical protein
MAATVKVKLHVWRSDTTESHAPGDVIEVSTDEARQLIESNQAEPVAETRAKRASKATATKTSESR